MKYIILLVFAASLFSACNQSENSSDAYGNFETETLIVSSESQGKILQLNIEKGQKISEGEIVAVIDTSQFVLQIKQIDAQEAAVNSKKTMVWSQIQVFEEQKKNLEINRVRIESMLKDGAATQKQLDDITGQINVTDKQIESTKTQLTSISKELEVLQANKLSVLDKFERCKIISPTTGTILETYAEKGELIAPGKPLFKMANLTDLTLKIYVSGAQLPQVKLGETVKVFIDHSVNENEKLTGTVTWISEEAEFTPKIIQTKEERVKLVYAVKVKVKNNGTLKIGMPGEVVFE